MVQIENTVFLSDIREQQKSRPFPEDEFGSIRSSVEAVPDDAFVGNQQGAEIKQLDAIIAASLSGYEYEHDSERGRNPACKLWSNEGFDHSVDLYNPEKRIAIEIEKSERKRVSDDILKFIKGGRTQRAGRKKIEFGCLVVPTNYRGSGNIFKSSVRDLRFLRSILFVEDIVVLGYRDPRWE